MQEFQTRDDIPVFLLTSQVGGLGLTLTAADRVIIVDPAWNPSVDNQSVDRAYRIGQRQDVVVYRLITCGTVEEKIYKKQVFKGGLSRSGTEEGVAFRYFSQQVTYVLLHLSLVPKKNSTQCSALTNMLFCALAPVLGVCVAKVLSEYTCTPLLWLPYVDAVEVYICTRTFAAFSVTIMALCTSVLLMKAKQI